MKVRLSNEQSYWIRCWWRAIQPAEPESERWARPEGLEGLGRADRAKCRRCVSLADLEQERAPNLLAAHFSQGSEALANAGESWMRRHPEVWFLVAGILAHVKEDAGNKAQPQISLAYLLGPAAVRKDQKAAMSELRFKRMMRARDPEEFFREARRAVQLTKGQADVAALAEDILCWYAEQDSATGEPTQGMKYRWARDYYAPVRSQGKSEPSQQ